MKKIINKVLGRDLLLQNQAMLIQQLKYQKELEWAHVFHDSIRGNDWLTSLPLNVGRWAGNYAFFYVLHRVLKDCRPKEILEFGLGESTKMVSTYVSNDLLESNHVIVEENPEWKENFSKNFSLSSRSRIEILPSTKNQVKGHETNGYQGIESVTSKKYDLYLIDGPKGSPHFSRYDIVNIAQSFQKDDEFVIIFDDVNRDGEKDTLEDLKELLDSKKIETNIGVYQGTKSVAVIGTKSYQFVDTL